MLLISGSKTIQGLDGLKEQGNKDGRKKKEDILATASRLRFQNFVKRILVVRWCEKVLVLNSFKNIIFE